MNRWWVPWTFALGCQASIARPTATRPPVAEQARPEPAIPRPPTPPASASAPASEPPPLLPELDDSKDIVTADRPSARHVAAMIVRGRYDARLVGVTARGRDRDVVAWAWSYRVSRGGLSDRVGGGQTDRSYPQLAIGALGSIAVTMWGRPN